MLKLCEQLNHELFKKNISWDKVQEIIYKNRDIINEFEDGYSTLSYLYDIFYNKGETAILLTKLFLENGFDVSANNGKNGASCLSSLCWSLYDQYILDLAELLLEEGSDPTVYVYEDENRALLYDIGCKKGGSWATDYYDDANIFEVYFRMIERAESEKRYKGIRAFRNSVGSVVERVEKIKYIDIIQGEKTIRTCYVLCCKDKLVQIESDAVVFVNPYAIEEAINRKNVTYRFPEIVGAKITGLRFQSPTKARLKFDNGYALYINHSQPIKVGTCL